MHLTSREEQMLHLLNQQPLTIETMSESLSLTYQGAKSILRRLEDKNLVLKSNSKPALWYPKTSPDETDEVTQEEPVIKTFPVFSKTANEYWELLDLVDLLFNEDNQNFDFSVMFSSLMYAHWAFQLGEHTELSPPLIKNKLARLHQRLEALTDMVKQVLDNYPLNDHTDESNVVQNYNVNREVAAERAQYALQFVSLD
jgi:hypothetical protein